MISILMPVYNTNPNFLKEAIDSCLAQTIENYEKDLLNKVSLVNVFGSWCAACITEHPFLMGISDKENINLIGMNWRDDRTKAINWLNYYGDQYDKIIYDDESTLAIQLGVTGAPESFIIDFQGQIRYKHVGIINKRIWEKDILPVINSINKV